MRGGALSQIFDFTQFRAPLPLKQHSSLQISGQRPSIQALVFGFRVPLAVRIWLAVPVRVFDRRCACSIEGDDALRVRKWQFIFFTFFGPGSTRTEFSLVSDVSGGAHSRPAASTGDVRSASDRARPAAAVGRRLCRSRSWRRIVRTFRVKLSSIADADLMPNRRATQASEHYDSTPGTSARADDTKWMLAHFM